ncbi:hypothetical protein F5Y15DRAFT_234825 [Xylariaceae sp. FL0016]|nr:hypothetical protein F5Y15DRAFT_234825 [Xylariaceae sp. FL0016]
MGQEAINELVGSLKGLFKSGAYSDLRIDCGEDQHAVHRAVVCPRSKRITELQAAPQKWSDDDGIKDVIELKDENPKAVRLMLHYLYHLDYLEDPLPATPTVATKANGQAPNNGAKPLSNLQNSTTEDVDSNVGKSLNYSIEHEQFVDTSTTTETSETANKTKKKNKKKRANTATAIPVEALAAQSTIPNGPTTTVSGTVPVNAVHSITPLRPEALGPEPTLSLHAQMYSLASRFSIQGLRLLAASKFQNQLESHWNTADFLLAAKEAYTSTDRGDRTMRDAVLGAVEKHPELLERREVQDVIRGLELSFDLLMCMKGRGEEAKAENGVVNEKGAVSKNGVISKNGLNGNMLGIGVGGGVSLAAA